MHAKSQRVFGICAVALDYHRMQFPVPSLHGTGRTGGTFSGGCDSGAYGFPSFCAFADAEVEQEVSQMVGKVTACDPWNRGFLCAVFLRQCPSVVQGHGGLLCEAVLCLPADDVAAISDGYRGGKTISAVV